MTVIDSARLGRISAQAARIRFVPLLLSLLALPLVLLGRAAFAVVTVARWTTAAVVVGYVDARESARAG